MTPREMKQLSVWPVGVASQGSGCPFANINPARYFLYFPLLLPKLIFLLFSPLGILQGLDTREFPTVTPSFPRANEEMQQ